MNEANVTIMILTNEPSIIGWDVWPVQAHDARVFKYHIFVFSYKYDPLGRAFATRFRIRKCQSIMRALNENAQED